MRAIVSCYRYARYRYELHIAVVYTSVVSKLPNGNMPNSVIVVEIISFGFYSLWHMPYRKRFLHPTVASNSTFS